MSKVASRSTDWIQSVCRRFTDATGWPLQFTSAGPQDGEAVEDRLRRDAECCWYTEIHNGARRVGFLHVGLPLQPKSDQNFLTVCELAEMTADLLQRVAVAGRNLAARNRELATLAELRPTISGENELIEALGQTLRTATQLTSFRAAAFFLLDPTTEQLTLRAQHNPDEWTIPYPCRSITPRSPDRRALSFGSALVHRERSLDGAEWMPGEASTGLCLAVTAHSGPLGTLWVYDRRARSAGQREMHVLESIAAQLAGVLERTVLLRESRQQSRIRRDLQVASESQVSGLPEELIGQLGFDVAAVCTSRYEIGGDMCELIPIGRNRTAIAIGDASGDSVPAAIIMSAVRGSARTITINAGVDLEQTQVVMRQINQGLCGMAPAHQFMSLLYGVLDVERMTFTYTNACHPTPILLRGGEVLNLESHGMLLGVLEDAEYHRSVLSLRAGDLLVCYSDGITEAMNGGRAMFRSGGIIGALQERRFRTAQEALDAIWSKLESHISGGGDPDDRTLLVIRL